MLPTNFSRSLRVVGGSPGIAQLATNAAVLAGGAGLVALGGFAVDQFKSHQSFQKMLQIYPELARENPDRVKLYFDSIATSSPNVAQNPLVVGSLIKRLMNYDGFDHSVHKDLVSVQSALDKNRLSGQGNMINLMGNGLDLMHTYRR